MAMGSRQPEQSSLWVATDDVPKSPGHPFYTRLNALLEVHGFDRFVEGGCREFYAAVKSRPGLTPGRYFRLLLVGDCDGIDPERGIAWRATDSLAIRSFLRFALDDPPPDHSPDARDAVFANRRRPRGARGQRLPRRRGEYVERTVAHVYDTGGMRRTHLRGHTNILKRLLIPVGGFNLGLVMRQLIGIGTPRGLQGRAAAVIAAPFVLLADARARVSAICASHLVITARRRSLGSPTHPGVYSSAKATCTTGW